MDLVPADAIVVFSEDNGDPLKNRYTSDQWWLGRIASVSESLITTTQAATHEVSQRFYLGAIVSSDRETIYWVNNTRPLP